MNMKSEDPHLSLIRRGVLVVGGATTFLGLVVLVGWYTQNVTLIQVLPMLAPMQFNTALCFALCGMGLTGGVYGHSRFAITCAAIAGCIGLATLAQYVFGLNFGIDELLKKSHTMVGTSHAGRMAPNTAFCFVLISVALISKEGLKESLIGALVLAVLGFGTLILSSVAVISYMSGTQTAYAWGQLTNMAVHTASAFLGLSLAVIALAWKASKTIPGIPGQASRVIVFVTAILFMSVVFATVSLSVIRELRQVAFEERTSSMTILLDSWSELIDVTASRSQSSSHGDNEAVTLEHIRDAYISFADIGATGEIVLARREGDEIVFLLPLRFRAAGASVSFKAVGAEPMRRALRGESGTLTGLDYRNASVLAAYRPANSYGWGLVAKVDMAEIWAPFTRVALLAFGIGIVVITAGGLAILVTLDPMVRGLVERTEQLKNEVAERQQAEETLSEIARGFSAISGESFFEEMVVYLSRSLGAKYSIVGKIVRGDIDQVATVAVAADGKPSENIVYDLAGTPCADVAREKICFHPTGVQEEYPDDRLLADMGVDAYAGTTLLDSSGTIIGILNVMNDVPFKNPSRVVSVLEIFASRAAAEMERMKNEEALQESEERFRTIFQNAPDAVLLMAAEGEDVGRILGANVKAEEMHGYSPGELTGMRITDLGTREVARAAPEHLRQLASGQPLNIEFEHRRKDGTVFPVEVTATRIVIGGETCVLAFDRDITERKRAQADKEESDARSAAIVEYAVDGIITIDEAGLIEDFNPAAEALFGFTHSEVLGRNVNMLMPQPYRSEHDGYLERYLKTGTPIIINTLREVKGKRKDGTIFPMKLSVSDVLLGERRLFTGIVRDLTHELELEQLLSQARKMESLGTLAGGIAHDFNNILQAILGFTKLAQGNMNGNDELLAECLREIEVGGRRAADLVSQILTFSHMSEVELESTKLQPLIKDALKFLRSSIPATIRIDSEIDAACGNVFANATQIHQLVTNLCTNAMHAMEEQSGGVLSVSLTSLSTDSVLETLTGSLEAGEYIQLTVADTGTGIKPELFHRLLDPFFTTKQVGKGTGLGLATVHGIIKSMGGGLAIESEISCGTTVRALLPVSRKESGGHEPKASVSPAVKGGGHVLLVDDEESLTKLSGLLLRSRGFTVESFNDVDSAIEALKTNPTDHYDLAILDYTMPKMTGLELAQEIYSFNRDIPVFLATGLLDMSDIDRSKSPNVLKILKKPFGMDELIDTLSRSR